MLADTAIAEKIRAKHEKELARTRRADARTVTLPPRAPTTTVAAPPARAVAAAA